MSESSYGPGARSSAFQTSSKVSSKGRLGLSHGVTSGSKGQSSSLRDIEVPRPADAGAGASEESSFATFSESQSFDATPERPPERVLQPEESSSTVTESPTETSVEEESAEDSEDDSGAPQKQKTDEALKRQQLGADGEVDEQGSEADEELVALKRKQSLGRKLKTLPSLAKRRKYYDLPTEGSLNFLEAMQRSQDKDKINAFRNRVLLRCRLGLDSNVKLYLDLKKSHLLRQKQEPNRTIDFEYKNKQKFDARLRRSVQRLPVGEYSPDLKLSQLLRRQAIEGRAYSSLDFDEPEQQEDAFAVVLKSHQPSNQQQDDVPLFKVNKILPRVNISQESDRDDDANLRARKQGRIIKNQQQLTSSLHRGKAYFKLYIADKLQDEHRLAEIKKARKFDLAQKQLAAPWDLKKQYYENVAALEALQKRLKDRLPTKYVQSFDEEMKKLGMPTISEAIENPGYLSMGVDDIKRLNSIESTKSTYEVTDPRAHHFPRSPKNLEELKAMTKPMTKTQHLELLEKKRELSLKKQEECKVYDGQELSKNEVIAFFQIQVHKYLDSYEAQKKFTLFGVSGATGATGGPAFLRALEERKGFILHSLGENF